MKSLIVLISIILSVMFYSSQCSGQSSHYKHKSEGKSDVAGMYRAFERLNQWGKMEMLKLRIQLERNYSQKNLSRITKRMEQIEDQMAVQRQLIYKRYDKGNLFAH